MSRSGYDDDCDGWALIRWRGAVASAIRGRRGQAFLRELAEALDELPKHELIAGVAEADGDYCALRSVAARAGRACAGRRHAGRRPRNGGADARHPRGPRRRDHVGERLYRGDAVRNLRGSRASTPLRVAYTHASGVRPYRPITSLEVDAGLGHKQLAGRRHPGRRTVGNFF